MDTISILFNSNCNTPTVLIELSERYYNSMKGNCINISGITITDNILSGAKITHYLEVTSKSFLVYSNNSENWITS